MSNPNVNQHDLGRIIPLFKGDYNPLTPYEINDLVRFPDGNVYWHISGLETTGVDNSNTTIWKLALEALEARFTPDDVYVIINNGDASETYSVVLDAFNQSKNVFAVTTLTAGVSKEIYRLSSYQTASEEDVFTFNTFSLVGGYGYKIAELSYNKNTNVYRWTTTHLNLNYGDGVAISQDISPQTAWTRITNAINYDKRPYFQVWIENRDGNGTLISRGWYYLHYVASRGKNEIINNVPHYVSSQIFSAIVEGNVISISINHITNESDLEGYYEWGNLSTVSYALDIPVYDGTVTSN